MRLFDSHCHLQDERFTDDFAPMIERAQSAGVKGFCCCATKESDWRRVLEISKSNASIVPSFGIHPWFCNSLSSGWIDTLKELLVAYPYAGVGEVGLDKMITDIPLALQQKIFIDQLLLAGELNRPLSIHVRKAWGEFLDIIQRFRLPVRGAVIHSYSGSPDIIDQLALQNLYFSFSGSITYDRNKRGAQSVLKVPLDRLLIETDSPDMLPSECPRFERNEPANLSLVAQRIAVIRHTTTEEIASTSSTNAQYLFCQH